MTQAELARLLHVDKTLVSRWANDRLPLRGRYALDAIEAFRTRGVDIELETGCRVFLSSPMAALDADGYEQTRAEATAVYDALTAVAGPVYWAAGQIDAADRFEAPDLATERNLAALAESDAFVFLQLGDVRRPTSCHVELGMAIASHKPVTVFAPSEESMPYMLRRFEVIAARSGGRYRFHRAADAVRLLEIHGADLLGLDAAVPA